MTHRKKLTRREEIVWRHPVEDIEPQQEPAEDSAQLLARIFRHLASLRGMGATNLGDEVAALAGVAVPECFPKGYRQPWLTLDHEDRAMLKAMPEFWAWLCMPGRRAKLSAIGHRTLAALYVMRPDLIDGIPLESLGQYSGVTRQALSKLVTEFRDCFGGVRNRAMKSDETRARCRSARRRPTKL